MTIGLKGFQKGHGKLRTIESYRDIETRKKISEATTRQMSDHNNRLKKEKNVNWKGEKASYWAIHIWLFTNFGRANKCENPECVYPRKNTRGKIMLKPKRYEWALIQGKEHGHFRENYLMLCSQCHRFYDTGIINIILK